MKKISIFIILFLLISQLVACNNSNSGINNDFIDNETDTIELNSPGISDDRSDDPVIDTSDESESNLPNQGLVDVGGSKYCDHDVLINHGVVDRSFHTIPGNLINYVGQDKFYKWVEKKEEDMLASNDGKCDIYSFSIVDFVEEFNIPRRDFEVINDNFLADLYDYNLDAIYAGKEEAEAYYLSDRSQLIREKRFIRSFKSQLRLYVEKQDAEAVQNWITEKNSTEWGFSEATRSHIEIPGSGYSDEFRGGYSQYTFAEFVDYFCIPRDVVEEIYLRCQGSTFTGTLNIDALFSTEAKAYESNNSDKTDKNPLAIDRSYIVYKTDNSAE